MKLSRLRHRLFGRALRTTEAPHQTIGKTVGLAVFASDSLSSVGYAGGEVLLMLAVLGAAHYWLTVPITVAIAGLLIILTFSYRQTIFAYPGGGGAYIVARDNLGEMPAQAAGVALLTDYILTVAVSVSSGVDQMASMFPLLFAYKVQIVLLLILLMTYVNLRGVRESGLIFALPTYFFVGMMLIMIVSGFWQAATGTLGTAGAVPGSDHATLPLTGFAFVFLLLRAFSSGTTALTGVEAISNGITAFQRPRSKNAATTLLWDAALLMVLFLGLGILGYLVGAKPSEQEVLISQVARTVFGSGITRFLTLLSATIILIMAANTSFADFPRLAALQAGDGFLPRQLTFRGSRLVFSWGIIILAAVASILVLTFQGRVTRLIPLYAIGVFMSFTLSQAGMVRRWHKIGRLMAAGELQPERTIRTHGSVLYYDRHWRWKLLLNGLGAVVTAVVTVVFLVTKFVYGAWIIAIVMPALLWFFFRIHAHYQEVARLMSTAGQHYEDRPQHVHTIVLVSDVHRETMRLVEVAQSLGVEWQAVHIAVYPERVPEIQRKWDERIGIGTLTIVPSPYRGLTQPLRHYIQKVLHQYPEGYVQVILGELRTAHPLAQLLHQNTHFIEQLALSDLDRVITTIVPLPLEHIGKKRRRLPAQTRPEAVPMEPVQAEPAAREEVHA
jgi:amino acid transporter